jgi:hypothetical protein
MVLTLATCLSCCLVVILDVTNGGFFGSVPTELGSLPDLRRVYLAYNALDGSIPPQLGQVSTLGTYRKVVAAHGMLA